MRRGASCYRSIIVTVLVVSSLGGKDSQSFGEVSAPVTSYNNGNSQNTLPETSAPDNNSSAPVTDLKPGTAEINRSGSSETSGNSFLAHDDGVYLLGISNVNDSVTDGYAISAMIPDSYFVEGKQFDKTALSLSNCYGEYYVMEDGVNNVYTTKDNPEMFVYMTVTLLKISGNSAEFKIEAQYHTSRKNSLLRAEDIRSTAQTAEVRLWHPIRIILRR